MSWVKWVSTAVALCLGLVATFALIVVLAILIPVMGVAAAIPAPTVLTAPERKSKRARATTGAGP